MRTIDDFLTVDQAAHALQVHPMTVRRLLISNQLPGRKIGKQWRLSALALERFISGEDVGNSKPTASAKVRKPRRRRARAGD